VSGRIRGRRGRITTADFDINRAGFVIAGPFVLVWAVAVAVWRLGDLERRWSPTVDAETAR
jgi:high-affinity nickel-transport protein